jgi:hypothetical protein
MDHFACTIDWEKVVRVFSAFLTPVIAITTATIALQQYLLNRNQFRLALLDRRLKPIDTDMSTRVIAQGRSVLASSVHLVCRPREHMNGSALLKERRSI